MEEPTENLRYYDPQETPRMYPLELTPSLHVCLWDELGKYKWTIALFDKDKDGTFLRFIGDRPLDKRVNWANFEVCVRQGQLIADRQYMEDSEL